MSEAQQPQSQIVEGLTGRLPFLLGSLVSFFSLIIFLRIRSEIHVSAREIDFDGMSVWLAIDALLLFVVVPIAHTFSHLLSLVLQKQPWQAQRRWLYPQIRPTKALSRAATIRYLLAPLGLNLVLLLAIFIEPIAGYMAFWGAINLGLTVGDIWKVLGVWRFPKKSYFIVKQSHLEQTEAPRG